MSPREMRALRECVKHGHGFFRGDHCQYCGEAGEELMRARSLDSFARIMAGVLRHFPDRFDLQMDRRGWVEVNELVEALRVNRRNLHFLTNRHVEALVETDEKGRYQLRNGRVRATYAHSIELELDLPTDNIPATLYFATSKEEAKHLLEAGLFPGDRQMVHLSRSLINALEAGRHIIGPPVVLEIDTTSAIADGHTIMQAGTTVFVTTTVEPAYISRHSEKTP